MDLCGGLSEEDYCKPDKNMYIFYSYKAWYKYSAFTLKLISNKEGFKKAGL